MAARVVAERSSRATEPATEAPKAEIGSARSGSTECTSSAERAVLLLVPVLLFSPVVDCRALLAVLLEKLRLVAEPVPVFTSTEAAAVAGKAGVETRGEEGKETGVPATATEELLLVVADPSAASSTDDSGITIGAVISTLFEAILACLSMMPSSV